MRPYFSKVMGFFGLLFAFALLAPSVAAADCGQPARDAVYKTVVTPGTDAVTEEVVVVVTPGTPGTPAVYEDVKVIDQEYVPGTPPTPPIEEISHMETVLVTPGTPEVQEVSHQECDTQYHFRKFTRTREGTKVKGEIVWGNYGPWTAWSPEQHTSWENSDAPLGSPAFHGEGKNGNVYWERQWQARFDGQTREVDCRKVIDVEYKPAVPPVYEEVKVIDQEYVPGTPGTPAIEEISHMEKALVTPEIPGTPAIEEVSHIEKRLVTPEVPPTPEVTRTDTVVVKEEVEGSSKQVLVSKATDGTEPCAPQLAQTGSDAGQPLLWGTLALLLGGLMVADSRKFSTQK